MLKKTPRKNAIIFGCKVCDFICSKKSNYEMHLATSKHKQLTNIENDNKSTKILSCDLCSKHYLWIKSNKLFYQKIHF